MFWIYILFIFKIFYQIVLSQTNSGSVRFRLSAAIESIKDFTIDNNGW